jgi:hypothetical protein
MSTDAALIEKRDELKRRLAIGEYKTLVDVVLDQTRQAIQKITHNRQPISTWYIATTLYLLFLLAAFAGLLIIGEYSAFQRQFAPFSRAFIPLSFLVGYFNVMSIIAGNIYIHRVLSVFHDTVIDTIDSVASLDDFERWLDAVCNRKVHFVFSAVGGFFVGMYLVYILNETGINVLLSTAIGTVILNSFSIVFLFLLLYMIALSARLGKYDLKLYSADPASSEAINRLADLLGTFVFLVAIYATLVTLVVATQQMLVQLGALVILLFWLPIIGMFVLNQSSLSSIIQRSKWRTLNGIQSRIEQLHSSEKLGEKETMDTINRLMDYSDRIKSTRTSRIDSRAVLNLINSLLLPLLALVLGNVDKIRGLFK